LKKLISIYFEVDKRRNTQNAAELSAVVESDFS